MINTARMPAWQMFRRHAAAAQQRATAAVAKAARPVSKASNASICNQTADRVLEFMRISFFQR
jgi:hypothetical protein